MGGAIQAHKSKTRLCANCNRTWRVGRAILESTQRNTRLCANCNSGRAHRSGRAAAHEVGVGGVRVRDNDVRAGRAVGRVHLLHQLRHEHVRGPVSPSTHRVKVQTARILSLKFQHAPRAARARWSRETDRPAGNWRPQRRLGAHIGLHGAAFPRAFPRGRTSLSTASRP